MSCQLDIDDWFVCDFHDAPGLDARWTDDPVPQPIGRPRYCGGFYDATTGHRYGGIWLDADAPTPEEIADAEEKAARAAFKRQREEAVAAIKVTTAAGNMFDGDEVSQGRMARAILGLQHADEEASVTWVLADNSVISATLPELAEALQLAGLAQAALWVQPAG